MIYKYFIIVMIKLVNLITNFARKVLENRLYFLASIFLIRLLILLKTNSNFLDPLLFDFQLKNGVYYQ